MSTHLTITLNRSQARWDSNTWALSLRSDFSPRITARYVGVMYLRKYEPSIRLFRKQIT